MFKRIAIANRGEVAVRIVRAASGLGIETVAMYARDDSGALHVKMATAAVALEKAGPAAYLDAAAAISAAQNTGCDAIHPGYGFLSERADFAAACAEEGIVFIGPSPEQLALFGDKARARAFAAEHGVPLMPGTGAISLNEARAFWEDERKRSPGCGLMLKAVGGGGGRGMRAVFDPGGLAGAYALCVSEANAAFGVEAIYAEHLMANARHIEIQMAGDGESVISLGERECTLQRRFQKLVEIAPSPSLLPALREQISACAQRLAKSAGYRGLGTFEFLADTAPGDLPFAFIEVNPRLQVEHTVTEEVMGLDLVAIQIALAAGRSLASLGLDPHVPPQSRGFAIQWRVNAETLTPNGDVRPATGAVSHLAWPGGPGIRVDSAIRAGTTPSPHYDTLAAKIVVSSRSGDFAGTVRKSRLALGEIEIAGLATNLAFLRVLANEDAVLKNEVHTRWIEEHWPALWRKMPDAPHASAATNAEDGGAVTVVASPMACKAIEIAVRAGAKVVRGQTLAILEAMKMHHTLASPVSGRVLTVDSTVGSYVTEGQRMFVLEPDEGGDAEAVAPEAADLDELRPSLQRFLDRTAFTLDENRPEAVAKRHAGGARTARENIAGLCEGGTFMEYGAFAIAAQTRRRDIGDLIRNTPADGIVTGIGTVNERAFGPEKSRSAVLAYDFTVLAGTQGMRSHQKTERLLDLAHKWSLPAVLFAEGGGGRPGDVDMPVVAGLHNTTFSGFARLSGHVPVVCVVHGRCFAGNAALAGCADVIIATKASNIGMGGPAMIEGGGLGVYRPDDIGPSADQYRSGVIDLLADDEVAATAAAKKYLAYFQGALQGYDAEDQRALRRLVPENRNAAYDVRKVIACLADTGSVLELRAGFGLGIVTALMRIEGSPAGIMANSTSHLGGAIDADAGDKAARFMQLCGAHGLPLVSLCDTPGFMVGPEIERRAQVRHVCRMFIAGAHLKVPVFSVVLRKGYGLGAQAMTAGGFADPVFTVSWPTGEFGAMNIEGSVKLMARRELEALATDAERAGLIARLTAAQYERGSAIEMAAHLEIDAVIDPAETRAWLARGLSTTAHRNVRSGRFVDPW